MKFSANDLEKKTQEVRLGAAVARAINEREGTDYFVEEPQHYLERYPEGAIEDVVLYSKSGAYPAYPIQAVTTPLNNHLELRSSNKNIESFQRSLNKALTESGFKYATVSVSLTRQSVLHKIPTDMVARCADLLVQSNLQEYGGTLDWRAINDFSPGLHRFVRHIYIIPASKLDVLVPRVEWTPSDRRLIQESVSEKESKYPYSLKSQTALVVGGSLFIDDEQVRDYLANARGVTFREVWIVLENRAFPLRQNVSTN